MKQRLITLVWMATVWVALWGDISVANALGGVMVGSAILLMVPPHGRYTGLAFRPFAALRLGVYFFRELVLASVVVAWEILTPADRLHQAIVAIPLRTRSPVLSALVANMVTLTPGTLTLDLIGDPPVLYLHVFYLGTVEKACAGIHTLEDRVIGAFGADTAMRRGPGE